MKKRLDHEPKRNDYGVPQCTFEELEPDPGDHLRPAYTYIRTLDGAVNVVEPHAPAALFGPLDRFEFRGDIFAGTPFTTVFVYMDEDQTYDIRSVESASVYRRFFGRLGEVPVARDRNLGFRPYCRRGKCIIPIEIVRPYVGVLIWPNLALNRMQLEEILASPGGFFRHLRLCVTPTTKRFSGATNTITGYVT